MRLRRAYELLHEGPGVQVELRNSERLGGPALTILQASAAWGNWTQHEFGLAERLEDPQERSPERSGERWAAALAAVERRWAGVSLSPSGYVREALGMVREFYEGKRCWACAGLLAPLEDGGRASCEGCS